MSQHLTVALKEWDMLCQALLAGEQSILLRKGGIHESAGEFELEHNAFVLFPTFVHQKPEQVKTAWRDRLRSHTTEPDQVPITGWAKVRGIFIVPDRPRLEQLDDVHIWAPPLLDMRFNYRPSNPLYLVVVQAFRLPAPTIIPNTLEYAGCKSWVPLSREVNTEGSTPASGEAAIHALLAKINQAFG